jgi:hypothetical protein
MEGLVHRPQSLDGQGVGYAHTVDCLLRRERRQRGRTGNLPSVIQVIRRQREGSEVQGQRKRTHAPGQNHDLARSRVFPQVLAP